MQTATAQTTSTAPDGHLTARLVRVKPNSGYSLHWPENFAQDGSGTRWRGGGGYVIDWSQDYEREWCRGQEHKLENVPADELETTVAEPPAHQEARRFLAGLEAKRDRERLAQQQASAPKVEPTAPAPSRRGPLPKTFREVEG